jgi:hypothetical protein
VSGEARRTPSSCPIAGRCRASRAPPQPHVTLHQRKSISRGVRRRRRRLDGKRCRSRRFPFTLFPSALVATCSASLCHSLYNQHLTLVCAAQIKDLGSLNGTYVNGTRIHTATMLLSQGGGYSCCLAQFVVCPSLSLQPPPPPPPNFTSRRLDKIRTRPQNFPPAGPPLLPLLLPPPLPPSP